MAYKLPALRFAYDALEPYIDAETMELHHDKHHQALRRQPEQGPRAVSAPRRAPVEDLLATSTRCRRRSAWPCATTAAATPTTQISGEILGPKEGIRQRARSPTPSRGISGHSSGFSPLYRRRGQAIWRGMGVPRGRT